MALFKKICSLIDLPGGTVLGLFSLEMLAVIGYCAVTGKTLSPVHRDIYLGVITAFAVNRTAVVIKGEAQ
jgi:hypothetical protein